MKMCVTISRIIFKMFCPMSQESVNIKFYLNMYFELISDLEISTVKKKKKSDRLLTIQLFYAVSADRRRW